MQKNVSGMRGLAACQPRELAIPVFSSFWPTFTEGPRYSSGTNSPLLGPRFGYAVCIEIGLYEEERE